MLIFLISLRHTKYECIFTSADFIRVVRRMKKTGQLPDYTALWNPVIRTSGAATLVILIKDSVPNVHVGVSSSGYIVNSFFRVEYLTYFSGCLACMWYRKLEFSEYDSSQ